ncbi:MAG: tetratricopeptide repeat protein [Gammaproteobacteria bacterium]|nr:tetratricopeptide repeat protein [Gammaproteobacteria bacterium]NNJ85504.1 tetratricopeptide repeat protein [Gammaproteobacteria bacterium]
MNTYESEQEQLEALQKWWKENGRAVIFGVLLGAIAIIGWSSWQAYTIQQAEKASRHYGQLLDSAKGNLYEKVTQKGNTLVEGFSNSGYTALASLVIAKAAFQQNDIDKAKTYLQLAMDQETSGAVQQLARLRMARLLMDEGRWEDAITLLDENAGEFSSLYEEIRGDIFLAQGEPAKARSAYDQSLASAVLLGGQSQVRIRTKLDDLMGDDSKRKNTRNMPETE